MGSTAARKQGGEKQSSISVPTFGKGTTAQGDTVEDKPTRSMSLCNPQRHYKQPLRSGRQKRWAVTESKMSTAEVEATARSTKHTRSGWHIRPARANTATTRKNATDNNAKLPIKKRCAVAPKPNSEETIPVVPTKQRQPRSMKRPTQRKRRDQPVPVPIPDGASASATCSDYPGAMLKDLNNIIQPYKDHNENAIDSTGCIGMCAGVSSTKEGTWSNTATASDQDTHGAQQFQVQIPIKVQEQLIMGLEPSMIDTDHTTGIHGIGGGSENNEKTGTSSIGAHAQLDDGAIEAGDDGTIDDDDGDTEECTLDAPEDDCTLDAPEDDCEQSNSIHHGTEEYSASVTLGWERGHELPDYCYGCVDPAEIRKELMSARTETARKAILSFHEKLHQLLLFKKKHGHTNVPQKLGCMGSFVNKMRSRRELLSPHKRAALDSIGFDWGEKRGMAKWMARYNEMVDYYHCHGHSKCIQPIEGYWSAKRILPVLQRFVVPVSNESIPLGRCFRSLLCCFFSSFTSPGQATSQPNISKTNR